MSQKAAKNETIQVFRLHKEKHNKCSMEHECKKQRIYAIE